MAQHDVNTLQYIIQKPIQKNQLQIVNSAWKNEIIVFNFGFNFRFFVYNDRSYKFNACPERCQEF